MAPTDHANKWKKDFDRAVGELKRTTAELHSWELLSGGSMAQRNERTAKGGLLRGKTSELHVEFQRLLRGIEELGRHKDQSEATKKVLAEWREELSRALTELGEVQRRSKMTSAGAAGGGAGPAGAASAEAGRGHAAPGAPTGDFQRLEEGGPSPGRGKGVDMQPVTQRSLFEQQQQMMREFDAPLAQLEGTVGNIGRAANLIAGEVNLQNRMLENTNEAADRTTARMTRIQRLMNTLGQSNANNRPLMCWVIVLLCALIGLFIWVVTE